MTIPPGPGILEDYALEVGDVVEVELLVSGLAPNAGPALVEGTVVNATTLVLVLAHPANHRRVRVRWAAIATIRTVPSTHPAHQ